MINIILLNNYIYIKLKNWYFKKCQSVKESNIIDKNLFKMEYKSLLKEVAEYKWYISYNINIYSFLEYPESTKMYLDSIGEDLNWKSITYKNLPSKDIYIENENYYLKDNEFIKSTLLPSYVKQSKVKKIMVLGNTPISIKGVKIIYIEPSCKYFESILNVV